MMRVLLCLLALSSFSEAAEPAVEHFTLTNKHGLVAKITNYGGIWTHMLVPDRDGKLGDILLGFDTPAGYQADHPYFGALVGRVANRIAKGRFELDGKQSTLAVNNGPNHLHGGLKGYDKVVWTPRRLSPQSLELTYSDPAGANGYPGKVDVMVVYTLTDENELRLDYTARSDARTPINLTNHAYFNLGGGQDILGHILQLFADRYTPVDDTLIPTGEILEVAGTDMDFTRPRPIGKGGYDHNFVVNGPAGKLRPVARVEEPTSGRVMEIFSDQPGVQFYSGNFLDGTLQGKGGKRYELNGGFCLETQHFPDSVHHPHFPSVILNPGETFKSTTVHRFSTAPPKA